MIGNASLQPNPAVNARSDSGSPYVNGSKAMRVCLICGGIMQDSFRPRYAKVSVEFNCQRQLNTIWRAFDVHKPVGKPPPEQ